MAELRQRFEMPNDSNRWDCPLFKVRVGEDASSSLSSPESSSAVHGAQKPAIKSSFKRSNALPAALHPDLTLSSNTPVIEKPVISPSSLSFSGVAAPARGSEETSSGFLSPETSISEICAFFSSSSPSSGGGGSGGSGLPRPNSSTIAAQKGSASLLYELDRTSLRVLQLVVQHLQQQPFLGQGSSSLRLDEFDRELTLHRHVGLAELQRHRQQFLKLNSQHPPASSSQVGALFIDFLATQL
eukprot:gene21116-21905_t